MSTKVKKVEAPMTSLDVKNAARAAGDNISLLADLLAGEVAREALRKDAVVFLMQRIHRLLGSTTRNRVLADDELRKRVGRLKGTEVIKSVYAAGV